MVCGTYYGEAEGWRGMDSAMVIVAGWSLWLAESRILGKLRMAS